MITIGITICDKDYTNCQTLLNQIESRVSVEHEVIIVDNREQYLDEPTEWKADYTFGYNAFQFTARKKIIELAKGDYIWFVDGDDTIIRLDEFDFTEDIIAYNLYSDNKLELVEDNVYLENLCTYEMFSIVHGVLWNKLIKKSLFDGIDDYADIEAVSLEDTFYLIYALVKAKSIRTCSCTTYCHNRGLSQMQYIKSPDTLRHLVKGNKKLLDYLKNVLKDNEQFYERYYEIHRDYLYEALDFIQKNCQKENTVEEVTEILAETIPEEYLHDELYEKILPKLTTKKNYNEACDVFKNKFGEDFVKQYATCTITYYDEESGEMKEREEKYLKDIIFPEEEEKWNHKLSIVCLVYDGNTHYLKSFTKMLDRVFVDHEVVIVDNRDNKTEPLEYDCEAVLVDNKKNLGILDGRRKGFENSTGDYVWFVDIDDEVFYVQNVNYGDSDVIVFPFEHREEPHFPQKGIVQKSDYWKLPTLWDISFMIWNKWIKRELLEKMYEKIPSFDCVYYEDNLLYYTMLEYAETIEVTNKTDSTIYNHKSNEDSTTCKIIKDTESIDRLFIGHEQALRFANENYSEYSDVLDFCLFTGIAFYMEIMSRADESVKAYFAEKIKALFPSKSVSNALEMIKDTNFGQTISSYFVTPTDNSI